MRDPCMIDGQAVVSFSGGRTSGMMLRCILAAHGGTLPDDVRVVFANTGKEMPETLDFVRECSERWSVPITWLEYADHDEPQQRWREVTYETASRNGEPFAELIGRKRLLPNPAMRICTSELKIRPMKLYAQQVLGFEHWDVAIGYRADEPRRVAKLSVPTKEPNDRCAPLAAAGVVAADVGRFWAAQPFDLALPNIGGKTMHGNCDLCYLKGAKQVFSLIREKPERAVWWAKQETRIKGGTGRGHLFRIDRPSYAAMLATAKDQGEMFAYADDEDSIEDCSCTD